MAKSPVGGSRAYLKGRIGSDVYTLGKDGKGKTQQVVRSLAEEVANPRTSSQMFGRMVMTTVMQAAKALNPIIDHSFDGFPIGQPSISQFIKTNYALVAADAKSNPGQSNAFGLNKYQEKGMKGGSWIVSNGTVHKPEGLSAAPTYIELEDLTGVHTLAAFKAACGMKGDAFATGVWVLSNGSAAYVRVRFSSTMADDTVITADNVATALVLEGNAAATVSFASDSIKVTLDGVASTLSRCVILSQKHSGQWKHSRAKMSVSSTPTWNSNTALPTYPVGSEQFLNGGDL